MKANGRRADLNQVSNVSKFGDFEAQILYKCWLSLASLVPVNSSLDGQLSADFAGLLGVFRILGRSDRVAEEKKENGQAFPSPSSSRNQGVTRCYIVLSYSGWTRNVGN